MIARNAKVLPAFLAASFIGSVAVRQAAAKPVRAMWVWNSGPMRGDPAQQAQFFRFLAAPHEVAGNAIGIVYIDGIHVEQFRDPNTVKGLRGLVAAAHARHVRVDFLCGDTSWATSAGRADGLNYVRAALDYNRAVAPNERFDGVQYDVEPYTLPGWPSAELEQGLLGLLSDARSMIASSGQPVKLSAAIPRWYGQAQFHYLDRGVIDRTDEVEVMDYVTTADQLVNDPADVLQYASRVHKKVWIGVETSELTDTPRSTFFTVGDKAMEEVLSAAAPRFAQSPAFAGYAIHHYAAYRDMKP